MSKINFLRKYPIVTPFFKAVSSIHISEKPCLHPEKCANWCANSVCLKYVQFADWQTLHCLITGVCCTILNVTIWCSGVWVGKISILKKKCFSAQCPKTKKTVVFLNLGRVSIRKFNYVCKKQFPIRSDSKKYCQTKISSWKIKIFRKHVYTLQRKCAKKM